MCNSSRSGTGGGGWAGELSGIEWISLHYALISFIQQSCHLYKRGKAGEKEEKELDVISDLTNIPKNSILSER